MYKYFDLFFYRRYYMKTFTKIFILYFIKIAFLENIVFFITWS